jgi:hypothetical protein
VPSLSRLTAASLAVRSRAIRRAVTSKRTRLIATTVTAVALAFPVASLAGITGSGGTNAKLTFSGQLAGKIKVAKKWNLGDTLTQAGCEHTVDKTSLNLFLYNVKLKLNGKQTALTGGFKGAAIDVFVEVQKYGDSESLANQSGDYLADVALNVYSGRTMYSWDTDSGNGTTLVSAGTVTTNAKGTAGSLTATMVPSGTGLPSPDSGAANAPVTVSGSWTSCSAPAH